ncbi:unnamed protein product, partial [Pylaiella littoralis]
QGKNKVKSFTPGAGAIKFAARRPGESITRSGSPVAPRRALSSGAIRPPAISRTRARIKTPPAAQQEGRNTRPEASPVLGRIPGVDPEVGPGSLYVRVSFPRKAS